MQQFDTIIIGSGVGGLTAAICLAKAGQKVLVLEQHDVPGGWCHSFHLDGHRFSPGVHYVGLMGEGDSTNMLFKSLGIANDLVFFKMNKNGYEHCHIGNEIIDMPADVQSLYQTLAARFPHEKEGLKNYLELVEKVSNQILMVPKTKGFWAHLTVPFRTKEMGKNGLFSLKKIIDKHISDPLLKAVLNIQCGDHGLPPTKASFALHCMLMFHYLKGGYYPMGGGAAIAKAMTRAIRKHNGEVRLCSPVQKILIQNKKAVGVELASGESLYAKNILSNADPSTTYLKLIGKQHLSNSIQKKLASTKYSVSSLILFLTLHMDVTKYGVDSGNIWYLRNHNMDEVYAQTLHGKVDEGEDFAAVFISCTTLKDPTSFDGRHHSFEVVTFVDYKTFDAFNNEGDYHSEAYTLFKQKIINKLMNNVERVIPNAKQHIVTAQLGTPKTNQHYIQSTNGSVYGTEKVLTQIGPFAYRHKSEIEGLFLCGASTSSHGVGGASHSGVEAAAKILNCDKQELLKDDAAQKLTIHDAEDSTTWSQAIKDKIDFRRKGL